MCETCLGRTKIKLGTTLPILQKMRFSAFKTFRRGVKIDDNGIDLTHTFPAVLIDTKLLEQYRAFFDFTEDLPFSYLYILAQRAQVALMLDKRFTISIPGMIHINNKLTQHEVVNPELPIEIKISITVESKLEGSLYPNSEVLYYQDGNKVATCNSGYLVKRKSKSKSKTSKKPKDVIQKLSSVTHSVPWELTKSLGKKYSNVSGDKNPIHSSKLFAKFLGFKRPIIHGWCSVSQVIKDASQFNNNVREVKVNFNKPIFLPSTVQIDFDETDAEINKSQFMVKTPGNDLIHLYGYIK
ncbi:MAG: hypothetical protein GPJ54_17940 [Candidatus Heimdallarchaeota archaeon]|nr:hypothetical protein [Candidatus Heimdallarchaeota archaeon]